MKKSYHIHINGIVQGVGFRPLVYCIAEKYNIKGWVSNEGTSVVMHLEGEKQDIKDMILNILNTPPPLSKVEDIAIHKGTFYGYKDFTIKKSLQKDKIRIFLSPDQGVCEKCMKEVNDPKSNRYRYPFTNCTDCGPRYSIIKSLPYDRKNTTMDVFRMCSSCGEEYNNPKTRRFHAQPNCCSHCGPHIELLDKKGSNISCKDPIQMAVKLLKEGYILAIKGIGGFHFCCNGEDKEAIDTLRRRKQRPYKPFALMIKDIEEGIRVSYIDEKEVKVLTSTQRPIVLLKKRESFILPESIAPNLNKIGLFLPYTPLHYLLFEEELHYLIMTSGNVNGRPMEYKNKQAVNNLGNIADYFLFYDREIENPIDDSVGRVFDNEFIVSRLARGFAPFSFLSNKKIEKIILGVGAEQKSNFCVMKDNYVHLGPYIGDLKDADSFYRYKKVLNSFMKLFRIEPNVIAYDLHPNYLSTGYAHTLEGKKIGVQHHHAHMVSAMVEHKLESEVIGVIYDGTGYGEDGAIWGGEFFVGTRSTYRRVGHLKYVSLQGGDLVMKELYRSTLGYLYSLGIDYTPSYDISIIKQALKNNLNCFQTSSMGRLFDCVSALAGICMEASYDAQGAIELENCINEDMKDEYEYEIEEREPFIVNYEKILKGIINDQTHGVSVYDLSAKFHNTICSLTVDGVCKIAEKIFLKNVVLSGGVFENQYLLKNISEELEKRGFSVFYNKKVPINDGGISFGQVEIARAILEGE